MNAEYDKLALFVQQSLGVAAVAVASSRSGSVPQQPAGVPDLLHSLSHAAAMTLQTQLRQSALPPSTNGDKKRAASKHSPSDTSGSNKKAHTSDTDEMYN